MEYFTRNSLCFIGVKLVKCSSSRCRNMVDQAMQGAFPRSLERGQRWVWTPKCMKGFTKSTLCFTRLKMVKPIYFSIQNNEFPHAKSWKMEDYGHKLGTIPKEKRGHGVSWASRHPNRAFKQARSTWLTLSLKAWRREW